MSITNPLRVPVWDDWSLANDNDGARTKVDLIGWVNLDVLVECIEAVHLPEIEIRITPEWDAKTTEFRIGIKQAKALAEALADAVERAESLSRPDAVEAAAS